MSWRKTTSTRQGTATIYGAVDMNNIMDLFNGVNTGQPVNINNAWNFTLAPTGNIVVPDGSITSAKIANGAVVDADVSATAAIAYSKLNLANSVTGADIAANTITDADISATAGIQKTKLNFGAGIVNADISSAAAIAYSKLNLAASIVNADIASAAAIAYAKLNLAASIVNADIAAGAAIAKSKLAALGIVDSDVTGPIAHSKVGTNLILSETGLTAPRTVTWPDATGKGVYEDNATTITNKTLGYRDNNLKNVRAMYHLREWGLCSVQYGFGLTLAGLMGGSVSTNPATSALDDINGHWAYGAPAANGSYVGFQQNAATGTRRSLNFRLRAALGCAAADSTARIILGAATVAPALNADTFLANTTSGVVMGARSTDANIQVFNNDSTGAMVVTDTGVQKGNDTTLRHLEIIASNSAPNFKCYLDGVLKATLTTRIPAATDNMYLVGAVAASSTTAITAKYQFCEIEHFGSGYTNWATDLPYAG